MIAFVVYVDLFLKQFLIVATQLYASSSCHKVINDTFYLWSLPMGTMWLVCFIIQDCTVIIVSAQPSLDQMIVKSCWWCSSNSWRDHGKLAISVPNNVSLDLFEVFSSSAHRTLWVISKVLLFSHLLFTCSLQMIQMCNLWKWRVLTGLLVAKSNDCLQAKIIVAQWGSIKRFLLINSFEGYS